MKRVIKAVKKKKLENPKRLNFVKSDFEDLLKEGLITLAAVEWIIYNYGFLGEEVDGVLYVEETILDSFTSKLFDSDADGKKTSQKVVSQSSTTERLAVEEVKKIEKEPEPAKEEKLDKKQGSPFRDTFLGGKDFKKTI